MSDELRQEVERLREVERALRESEEKYRTLIESLPHGVAIIQHGIVVFVNRALIAMLGVEDAKQLLGTNASLPMPESERPRVIALLTDLVRGQIKGPLRYRTRGLRASGEEFPCESFADLITYQGSRALQIVIVDESEQVKIKEKHHALQAQMRQVQKLESLGLLAGGIAHDFNNLLMTILGNANLVAMDLPAGDKAQANLKQIETAARRAAELTGQMLAYAGRGSFQTRSFMIDSLVRELGQLLRSAVPRRINLIYNFADALPAVVGDPSQIRQIVMNLITNAAEAIGDKEGQIVLSTWRAEHKSLDFASAILPPPPERAPPGGWALLEVRDTGGGIADDDIQRMFDPFFTTKFTGRGLGLAAVLGIVRAHAGALWVESEIGRGACFRLALPGAPPRSSHEEANISRPTSERQTGILVVEDEPEVAQTLQEALAHFGHRIWLAADGHQALEKLDEIGEEIEIVLLDLTMPGLSGLELFERIQERRPGIAVILTSGYAEEDALTQLGQASDLLFVQKPASVMQLKAAVDEALKER